MLKPLELTICPVGVEFEDGPGNLSRTYMTPHGEVTGWQADRMSKQKRLTAPELAAEYESARCDYLLQVQAGNYWAPLDDTWSSEPDDVLNRAMTLLRFATLPHYDEKETP